jgi:thiol-disulfide isomerase/thioredoxin
MTMLRRLFGLCLLLSATPAWAAPGPGDRMPNVLGRESRSGEEIRVDAHRGRVMVVSFWASWCGPCMQELPVLESLQQQVSTRRLRVVAINYQESQALYTQHLKKMKEMRMGLVHDADGDLADSFGVESLPHMFMVDHEGRVAHVHQGYSREALPDLVREINALLKAQSAAAAPRMATAP